MAKTLLPNGRYHKAPASTMIDHEWSIPWAFRAAITNICWRWRWSERCSVITGGRAICVNRRQHLCSTRNSRGPGVCDCHFEHLCVHVKLIMRHIMFFVCSLFLRFYLCVLFNIVMRIFHIFLCGWRTSMRIYAL